MRSRALLIATTGALVAAAAGTAAPAPRLLSATVVGDRATLLFSSPIAPRGRVTVTVNGHAAAPMRTTYAGRRIAIVLRRGVYSDDLVRVHGSGLRTQGGARLRSFGATAANRSTAGCSLQLGSLAAGIATEGPTDPATFLPPRRLAVLVVAVDYADAPWPPSVPRFSLSAANTWIEELSYGRAGVAETAWPGTVRMPKAWAHYAFSGPWAGRKTLFQDLVQQLDGEVDFSRYDALYLSSAHDYRRPEVRYEYTAMAPAGQGVVADGRELRHFGVTPEAQPGIGFMTVQHWLGLPFNGAALRWNIPGMFSWHRRKLGWLDAHQVRCVRDRAVETDLGPVALGGGTKLVVAPYGPNRAIVVENRQRVGLDSVNYPCNQGLLAYEVDTTSESTPIRMLPRVPLSASETCGPGSDAPYDLQPGSSARIGGLLVHALSRGGDGTYRVRISRVS